MPFVWSIGTIIGPCIGGMFADPNSSWPEMFPKGSLFERFPYLLPNLLCAFLLLISIILGFLLLEETHPDLQPKMLPMDIDASEETPLIAGSTGTKKSNLNPRESYGAVEICEDNFEDVWAAFENEKRTLVMKIWNKSVVGFIVALSIFTYHSMTYDHLMPIFFEDDRASALSLLEQHSVFYSPGGLGLSLRNVGMIMAVNGAIALFVQAVIFPVAAERIGVYRLFIIVTVLHPIAYVLVPMLLLVPQSLLYPAIYLCLTVRNILSIILYPLLLILIKEATPAPSALGKVNGLAASAGAACRMIAPPIAGYLYTFGTKIDCTALAWYGSAIVAVFGAIQCFWVPRARNDEASEEAHVVQYKQTTTVAVTEISVDDQ